MKRKITSAALVCFIALVFVYLFAGVMPSLFSTDPITVQNVSVDSYDDVLRVNGIALRDETVVSAASALYSADYKVADGDRVAAGDILATYSSRLLSAQDQIAIDELDRQIDILTQSLSNTSQYDLSTLDVRTQESLRSYLDTFAQKDLSVTAKSAETVLRYFIRRNIKVQNNQEYYASILKNCENSRSAILSGYSASMQYVKTSSAGYFSSRFDGYESFRASDYEEADVGQVRQLLSFTPSARAQNYVGKLQHYSFWSYLCLVPQDRAASFSVGSSWRLRFPGTGTGDVTMIVKHVSEPQDGFVALSFEGMYFSAGLYAMRITDAEIVLRSYSGFRIPQDALRVSQGISGIADGTDGVYVLSGVRLIFKPVKVQFRSEDGSFAMVASAAEKNTDRNLYVNDAVVIGGKDIHDGKIVNIN